MDLEPLQAALALRDAGKVEEALREFEELANRSSHPRDKINFIGNQVNCLIRLGRVREARERWQAAEEIGTDVYSKYQDAWLCVEEGKRKEAVQKFSLLLKFPIEEHDGEFDPTKSIDQDTYVQVAEKLVGLLVSLERYAEAIPIIEDALRLAEADQRRRLCFYLGVCYFFQNRWQAAEEKLTESIPPEDEGPWWLQGQYYLGICHLRTGNLELAEQELLRGLPADREDPFWVRVQYQLGRLYFARGAYIKARQAFEMSEFFEPDAEQRKHVSAWLAAVRARLGDREPSA